MDNSSIRLSGTTQLRSPVCFDCEFQRSSVRSSVEAQSVAACGLRPERTDQADAGYEVAFNRALNPDCVNG